MLRRKDYFSDVVGFFKPREAGWTVKSLVELLSSTNFFPSHLRISARPEYFCQSLFGRFFALTSVTALYPLSKVF